MNSLRVKGQDVSRKFFQYWAMEMLRISVWRSSSVSSFASADASYFNSSSLTYTSTSSSNISFTSSVCSINDFDFFIKLPLFALCISVSSNEASKL